MTLFARPLLLAGVSLLAMAGAPAYGQTSGDETANAAEEIVTVVVTGTRRSGRTVADSPVPIDVIVAENLARSGFTETNRLLNEQLPSFNFPQPSITDGTDVVRPATLRGLGPDQTLVLINGKRRHTASLLNINGSVGRGTSAVDINLIPSIALSRVEVLRDGAAAQYGSDAIAGVINFQLRDKPEGGRITATYGQYDTSLRGVPQFTGLALGSNGQPAVVADGTYGTTDNGKNRRESDGETLTIAGVIGLPLGDGGYINFAGEYQDRGRTNRAGYDPRRQYNLVAGLADTRELTFDRLSHIYGDAATKDIKLVMNASRPISDSTELYSFATYGFRDGQSAGFYRIASDARNVPAIYPDGFLPRINTELNDYAGTVGLKGELADWRWDVSGQYGINRFDFNITNSLNRSFGTASPQAFDSGGLRYAQTLLNLDVSRELVVGFAQSFTLAGGLEYRRETFDIRPGEALSYANGPAGGAPGAQVFPGFRPSIGGQQVDQPHNRRNVSAYAELDVDVSDRFSLQAAGRFEDYSDFGVDWNGKLAARFEPATGFALRGAIATGFRAPSLQQQFFAASATNNVNGVLLETVTLPVDNPVAIALGAVPLQPETSVSYSVGFVFTAIPRLSVTVDLYQIDIDDRIVVTENLQASRDALGNPNGTNPGIRIAQILNDAGFNNINAARFFLNGVDTITRGVDVIATYRMDLGGDAKLGLTAGFNHNKTDVKRVLTAAGPLATVPGIVLFGRQETLRLSDGQPRSKINLGLDYDRGWFGMTLRTNRYGKVLGAGSDPFLDVPLSSKWVADLEMRGTFNDKVTIAVGANNLLDVYPDRVPFGRGVDAATGAARNYPVNNYFLPYSNFSPFGFNGRFLYARASMSF